MNGTSNILSRLPVAPVVTPGAAASGLANGQVLRMSDPGFVQRKCSHGTTEEQVQRKTSTSFLQKKSSDAGSTTSDAVSAGIAASRGNGSAMDAGTLGFMESRFGTDFSQVKIHNDDHAVQLSQELHAQAFTTGNDIYFNKGRYNPGSDSGKHLLAHELTHTLQQGGSRDHIARFSDTGHHIIEEAGLKGGGFSKEEIKAIEAGNIKRDYSQAPPILNFLLLCTPGTFGGYKAEEHFDNFIWDDKINAFRDRDAVDAEKAGLPAHKPRKEPLQYIEDSIGILMNLGRTPQGFEHLGNAFHAVEDLFAHSNFIELSQQDYRFGKTLLTGSNDEGAAQIATANSLNAVSLPDFPVTPPAYKARIKKNAPPLSHSQIAKDYPGDPHNSEARQLAALVVQDLSRDLIKILNIKDKEERMRACVAQVFPKIRRYLRPPDPKNDPWWETLIANDAGAIDELLSEAETETPVMVNQCMLSPLKNLEATRYSGMRSMGILNPAVSLGRFVFRPAKDLGSNVDLLLGAIPSISLPFKVSGGQANLTVGGMLFIPPDGNLLPQDQRSPSYDLDKRKREPEVMPQSGVGISIGGQW